MTGYKEGIREALPIMVGYVPLGLAAGLLLKQAGLSVLQIGLMSMLVFGGSSQFATAALLMNEASFMDILLMIILLNSRQMLFTSSLAKYLKEAPLFKTLLLCQCTTDESYAMNMFQFEKAEKGEGQRSVDNGLWVACLTYTTWCVSTIVGALLGGIIAGPEAVMNYVLTAMFIGLLIPQLKTRLIVMIAGLSGLLAIALAPFLPTGVNIMLCTLVSSYLGYWLEKRRMRHLRGKRRNL